MGNLQAKILELSNKEDDQVRVDVSDARKAGKEALGKLLRSHDENADIIDAVLAEYEKMSDAAASIEKEKAFLLVKVKDRDAVCSELTRTRAVKDKLEELCRSLQKQVRSLSSIMRDAS